MDETAELMLSAQFGIYLRRHFLQAKETLGIPVEDGLQKGGVAVFVCQQAARPMSGVVTYFIQALASVSVFCFIVVVPQIILGVLNGWKDVPGATQALSLVGFVASSFVWRWTGLRLRKRNGP